MVSLQLRLGPNGVEEVLPFGKLTPYEQSVLDDMIPDLVEHAEKGVNFVREASSNGDAAAAK
jgi:malate dehydrogenase